MEIQQLKYFLEVANTQHITRSAEKLNISQPSLSQSIRRLEEELGVKLFASRGRNIVLTESGEFLKEKLEPVMQRLDAIPEQLKSYADTERTTIRLHVTAASAVVSEAVIEYRRKHEYVNFQFLLNDDEHLSDMSIESAITPPKDIGQDVFTCNEKIYIAVPNNYNDNIDGNLRDFSNEDFISLISQKQFRRICDHLCAQAGFTPNIAFESDSPETVRNMISANMGVGFWPAFTWGRIHRENVKLIDIKEPVCSRCIVIKRKRNRVDNKNVEEFFEFLTGYMLERMYESYGLA